MAQRKTLSRVDRSGSSAVPKSIAAGSPTSPAEVWSGLIFLLGVEDIKLPGSRGELLQT